MRAEKKKKAGLQRALAVDRMGLCPGRMGRLTFKLIVLIFLEISCVW